MSVNKVILVGRLGQDPELKYTSNGQSVCNFSMATSENWTDKSGQKQERTEWHRIVVWGRQAEHCNQYLKKGRQVYLEGKLQTRSWEDQQGQKRYTTEIQAFVVQFLGGASQSQGMGAPMPSDDFNQAGPSDSSSGGGDFSNNAGGSNNNMAQTQTTANDSHFTADDIPF